MTYIRGFSSNPSGRLPRKEPLWDPVVLCHQIHEPPKKRQGDLTHEASSGHQYLWALSRFEGKPNDRRLPVFLVGELSFWGPIFGVPRFGEVREVNYDSLRLIQVVFLLRSFEKQLIEKPKPILGIPISHILPFINFTVAESAFGKAPICSPVPCYYAGEQLPFKTGTMQNVSMVCLCSVHSVPGRLKGHVFLNLLD